MTSKLTNLLLSTLSLAALVPVGLPAFAADHRDSPAVDDDPAADINDVYMFRDPNDSSKLVLVLSTYPLGNPRFATSYQYDPDVVFQIAFDFTGEGHFSDVVTAQFSPLTNGAGSAQTFTVTLPNGKVITGPVTQPTIQAPEPTALLTKTEDGCTIFAGQRDDPFFFDLVGFNRVVAGINATSVNGGPGVANTALFTGIDAFAGFNVEALVIEAPITDFVGNAQQFGISAFSYRKLIGSPRAKGQPIVSLLGEVYTQVDRMGNPAVNTAFIPAGLKDEFNDSEPDLDAVDYGKTIAATLKKYGTNAANTAVLESVVFPDTLKMDLAKPDGFPNGRRLADPSTNIELQLVFNQPVGGSFGDGVKGNDVPYLSVFPFVAPPHTSPK
jgi:Domain of unknown function (DUF4331)